MHEELAEVGLVCQSIPRALQYITYTIDKMFSDGLLELEDDGNSVMSDLPSMVNSERYLCNKHNFLFKN
jgi:hypothetical protein